MLQKRRCATNSHLEIKHDERRKQKSRLASLEIIRCTVPRDPFLKVLLVLGAYLGLMQRTHADGDHGDATSVGCWGRREKVVSMLAEHSM